MQTQVCSSTDRPCDPEGQPVSLGPSLALRASLAPTVLSHFPSLQTRAWLRHPPVLRPHGPGQGLRPPLGTLVGSKALSSTGKALMTLPMAKVFICLPPNSALKLEPSIPKPKKVGLVLGLTLVGSTGHQGQGWGPR